MLGDHPTVRTRRVWRGRRGRYRRHRHSASTRIGSTLDATRIIYRCLAKLQRDRQIRASYQPDEVQFHDRSVICTAALTVYLGHPVSPVLARELERIKTEAIYQNRVFFIRNLGFITPTEARRISFDDALRFEKIHEQMYEDFGFELVSVVPGSLAERVRVIKRAIR